MSVPQRGALLPEAHLETHVLAEGLMAIMQERWPKGFGARTSQLFLLAVETLIYANVEAVRSGEEPPYSLFDLSHSGFLAISEDEGVAPPFRAQVLNRLRAPAPHPRADPGQHSNTYETILARWEDFEAFGARKQLAYTQPIVDKIACLVLSHPDNVLRGRYRAAIKLSHMIGAS